MSQGRVKGSRNFVATKEEQDLVEIAVSAGLIHEQIALFIRRDVDGELKPISVDTLTRHFGPQLESGLLRMQVKIAGRVMRVASGLDPRATVREELVAGFFFLKTRCGFRETDRSEPLLPETDADADAVAIAARVAGLLDLARRQAEKGGDTLQ